MVLCGGALWPTTGGGAAPDERKFNAQEIVSHAVVPLMERYGIPGIAVGVVRDGQREVYHFGVASKSTGQPVGTDTLFEIGSISKAFTATLAAYEQVSGRLSLSDPASRYFPALRGSAFDRIRLLDLGTHTSGGLPLQVPETVTNDDQLIAYFKGWKPVYAPGTYRTYSNPGIGLLGLSVAKSLDGEFDAILESTLFQAFGMKETFLHVPANRRDRYAQGYTDKDVPIRMAPGALDSETYGIKTTAADLLRFVAVNLQEIPLDEKWRQAVAETHTGYYRVGAMTQDLVWEQYDEPVALPALLEGNSANVSFEANPVVRFDAPLPPKEQVVINKTGSTNGFSAYVVFAPGRKVGVLLLANKSYPIDARVRATWEILTGLEQPTPE